VAVWQNYLHTSWQAALHMNRANAISLDISKNLPCMAESWSAEYPSFTLLFAMCTGCAIDGYKPGCKAPPSSWTHHRKLGRQPDLAPSLTVHAFYNAGLKSSFRREDSRFPVDCSQGLAWYSSTYHKSVKQWCCHCGGRNRDLGFSLGQVMSHAVGPPRSNATL
jgi:hypothetical protein